MNEENAARMQALKDDNIGLKIDLQTVLNDCLSVWLKNKGY